MKIAAPLNAFLKDILLVQLTRECDKALVENSDWVLYYKNCDIDRKCLRRKHMMDTLEATLLNVESMSNCKSTVGGTKWDWKDQIIPIYQIFRGLTIWTRSNIMKDADCCLVDNMIAKKLILPTFRLDAPVLLKVRVKLSRGTSQFIGSSWSKVATC